MDSHSCQLLIFSFYFTLNVSYKGYRQGVEGNYTCCESCYQEQKIASNEIFTAEPDIVLVLDGESVRTT